MRSMRVVEVVVSSAVLFDMWRLLVLKLITTHIILVLGWQARIMRILMMMVVVVVRVVLVLERIDTRKPCLVR